MLHALLQEGLKTPGDFQANWHPQMSAWLKTWSTPWFVHAADFKPGMRVLDVGSASGHFAYYMIERFGCEMHALDVPTFGDTAHFGSAATPQYPGVVYHVGLAGEDVLPAESFDVVYCNSTIEHTYDQSDPVDPERPLRHLEMLRDLCRMVRPGGLLMINWDTYLDGVPHHLGWDYEADFWLLHHSGMRLADPRRRVQPAHYVISHPDTLFFSFPSVMPFQRTTMPHGVAINAVWYKPGAPLVTRLMPFPHLTEHYLPGDECVTDAMDAAPVVSTPDAISTGRMETRFRRSIEQAQRVLGRRLWRGTAEGNAPPSGLK